MVLAHKNVMSKWTCPCYILYSLAWPGSYLIQKIRTADFCAGVIPYMIKAVRIALKSAKRRNKGFTPTELVDTLGTIAVNDLNKVKVGRAISYLSTTTCMIKSLIMQQNSFVSHNLTSYIYKF